MYEALTVVALSFVCAGLFVWLAGDATHGIKRLFMQLFLWLAIGAYFIWCWLKSGQTLAMQAWQLKLVNQENQLLTLRFAMARYLLATLSLALFGLGFLWAVFDSKRLFLHDRLLKCKVVVQQK
jgi:uncharacterized RDD family membrane protein YckC